MLHQGPSWMSCQVTQSRAAAAGAAMDSRRTGTRTVLQKRVDQSQH
jgi:hypothetical protein